MRKFLLLVLCVLLLQVMPGTQPADAAKGKADVESTLRVIGSEDDSREVSSILAMIDDLMQASNAHDLEGVLKHYSPEFISGDNLNLTEIRKLIEETWTVYPDIRYDTQTLEIRVNGDWATVESIDTATATVNSKEGIITTPGALKSRSRGMIYLRRIGKTWEITSDYTLYENATILYGDAQDLKFDLSAPDQVFASEPYTARLNVDMPPGMVAIASISKDPLVYPQRGPEDKFRSMSSRDNNLERVFEANGNNHNEIVTATIGLTQIGQDSEDRPTVRFKGIATVVKRVNVVPRTATGSEEEGKVVRYSASGHIDLRKKSQ